MIFINNSADYSECGLGKAPVITDETKQLLSGFTGINFKKAIAFQEFVDAIGGTDGVIWNAIDNLYIPMFANSVLKDAFFNVKTGQIEYSGSANVITDENVANHYVLTDSGVKILSSATSNTNYIYTSDKTTANCLIFAVSEPISNGGKNIWNVNDTGTNSTAIGLKNSTFGSTVVQIDNTSGKCPIFLSSRITSEGSAYLKSGSEDSSINTSEVTVPRSFSILFGSGPTFETQKWTVGLKLFGFGDGISAANALILANAISSFNDKMLVA